MIRREPYLDLTRATIPASCLTAGRLTAEQRAYIRKRGIDWKALDDGKRSDILHYLNNVRQQPSFATEMITAIGMFFGRLFLTPAPVARRA